MSDNPSKHMAGDSRIDKLVTKIGNFSSWLCLALVLLQFGVVVARYLFDVGSVSAQEAILYLFGTMFMLSLADALRANRHVRVDMLYHDFNGRTRRKVDTVGIIIFIIPLCLFLLWESWTYVASSWAVFERSREVDGLPGVFLYKTVILIALVLVILQAIAILRRCIHKRGTSDDD